MKKKTQIDKLIPYLKGGYRSSFEMQQYLKSSSGDRTFRYFREYLEDNDKVFGLYYGYIPLAMHDKIATYQLKDKECHKPDGHRYLRWKLVKV